MLILCVFGGETGEQERADISSWIVAVLFCFHLNLVHGKERKK